jgi:hypothetical protein
MKIETRLFVIFVVVVVVIVLNYSSINRKLSVYTVDLSNKILQIIFSNSERINLF